jgi:hypothetical protein
MFVSKTLEFYWKTQQCDSPLFYMKIKVVCKSKMEVNDCLLGPFERFFTNKKDVYCKNSGIF